MHGSERGFFGITAVAQSRQLFAWHGMETRTETQTALVIGVLIPFRRSLSVGYFSLAEQRKLPRPDGGETCKKFSNGK
jgi:hypothetical protein